MNQLSYYHVDVFAQTVFHGNGLTVVFADQDSLPAETMLAIAQEFKQYETAFVFPEKEGIFPVRVFTVQEELPFAGHPLIGVGALLHKKYFHGSTQTSISLQLPEKAVTLISRKTDSGYAVELQQGTASFTGTLPEKDQPELCRFFHLSPRDLAADYPLEIVSTGLPYLLVPVAGNLDQAYISEPHFEEFLSRFGAKFAYLFDPATLECRTWDNSGLYEDCATGSAAGPLIAYLLKHEFIPPNEVITLSQGSFMNRPSTISGWKMPQSPGKYIPEQDSISIIGDVTIFSEGTLYW